MLWTYWQLLIKFMICLPHDLAFQFIVFYYLPTPAVTNYHKLSWLKLFSGSFGIQKSKMGLLCLKSELRAACLWRGSRRKSIFVYFPAPRGCSYLLVCIPFPYSKPTTTCQMFLISPHIISPWHWLFCLPISYLRMLVITSDTPR